MEHKSQEENSNKQQAISKRRSSSNSVLLTLFFFVLLTSYFILPAPVHAFTISKPFSNNLGLVGHWTFDGKDMPNGRVNDISGNDNAGQMVNMSTSTAYVLGRLGQALRFDGVDDYVQKDSNPGVTNYPFTLAAWMKISAGNTHKWAVWMGDKNDASEYGAIGVTLTGFFGLDSRFASGLDQISSTISPDDKWHHVVGVYNSATSRELFVDGVSHGTDNTSHDFPVPVNRWAIGYLGDSTPDSYFPGSIDDVRIYSRALSGTEIKTVYSQGAGTFAKTATNSLTDGLVGHWTFDGKDVTGGTIRDISGQGNHGSANSIATSTFFAMGKVGQGVKFDGIDDSINLGSASSLDDLPDQGGGGMTVAFWMKQNVSTTSQKVIMVKGPGTSNSGTWTISKFVNADDRLQFSKEGASDSSIYYNDFFDIGSWQHVVVTWNGSMTFSTGVKFYKNGELFSGTPVVTDGASANSDASHSLCIGNYSSGTGCNNNVIYENDMNLDDVRIYNKVLTADEVKALYNTTVPKVNATPKNPLTNGLVGHWTFDGKDMPNGRVNDVSGQGNHGSQVNMSTSTAYVLGKLGQGINFDAVNDRIDLGSTDFVGTGPFSLSFWINPIKIGGRVFSTGELVLQLNTLGRFSFSSNLPAGFSSGLNCYAVNAWTHVVATRDELGLGSIYCNGVVSASNQDSGTPTGATENLTLGNRVSGVEPLGAVLDDVRMYNRVLSLEEVKVLYNMGK